MPARTSHRAVREGRVFKRTICISNISAVKSGRKAGLSTSGERSTVQQDGSGNGDISFCRIARAKILHRSGVNERYKGLEPLCGEFLKCLFGGILEETLICASPVWNRAGARTIGSVSNGRRFEYEENSTVSGYYRVGSDRLLRIRMWSGAAVRTVDDSYASGSVERNSA